MTSSNNNSDSDPTNNKAEFLIDDADQPLLHLSNCYDEAEVLAGLQFEFILDDATEEEGVVDDHADHQEEEEERLFAVSKGSLLLSDFDCLLPNSSSLRGSHATIDVVEEVIQQCEETLESSLNDLHFDTIILNQEDDDDDTDTDTANDNQEDDDDDVFPSYNHYKPASRRANQRARSPSPQDYTNHQAMKKQRFQINTDVRQAPVSRYQREPSVSDLSMFSCDTSACTSSSPSSTPKRQPIANKKKKKRNQNSNHHHGSTFKAHQLQKLAESMKRTEESRRQVIIQTSLLPPQQLMALTLARDQILQENQRVLMAQQQQQQQMQQQQQSQHSSIMAAFFSGSRGTLTNGLEQSRRQLNNYMCQMNHRAL